MTNEQLETWCHDEPVEAAKRIRELEQESLYRLIHITRLETPIKRAINPDCKLSDLGIQMNLKSCLEHRDYSKELAAHDAEVIEKLRFPTMLRKMWSGGEVQEWLNNEAQKLKDQGK